MARCLLRVAWALGLLLVVGTGCRMCEHPYDYCGAVYSGGWGECCDPSYRAGSILSPGAYAAPVLEDEVEVIDDYGAQLAPTPATVAPSPTPASPQWVARRPRAETS